MISHEDIRVKLKAVSDRCLQAAVAPLHSAQTQAVADAVVELSGCVELVFERFCSNESEGKS